MALRSACFFGGPTDFTSRKGKREGFDSVGSPGGSAGFLGLDGSMGAPLLATAHSSKGDLLASHCPQSSSRHHPSCPGRGRTLQGLRPRVRVHASPHSPPPAQQPRSLPWQVGRRRSRAGTPRKQRPVDGWDRRCLALPRFAACRRRLCGRCLLSARDRSLSPPRCR